MEEKVKIINAAGEIVLASAPVIISASRSTDIPAFYAKWFINRLKAGYCVWYNPFNHKPLYVSFEKCRAVVFWTKNPKPLMPYLEELDNRGINYYFQFTLNDYVNEGFEPNVASVKSRLETFIQLSERIGKERVIWRFDPIIITPQLSPREILKKIWRLGDSLRGHTDKLVFSFVDVAAYRKVQNNLVKETLFFNKGNVLSAESSASQIQEIVEGLVKCRNRWKEEGWEVALATCAEKIDLDSYGIEHNRCIDGELMKRIFKNDIDLVYYINYGKLPDHNALFDTSGDEVKPLSPEKIKDKGQRKECGCMISKDIGMYNTCLHNCVYCYANTSKELVSRNASQANPDGESIISFVED